MKRVIARIRFLDTKAGGRASPLDPTRNFGCPVFFEDIPALSDHAYDCRILVPEHGKSIAPGETAEQIAMIFLYPEDVLPHLAKGSRFTLWEAGTIAHGEVSHVE